MLNMIKEVLIMFKQIYKWTNKIKNKLNEKGQGMVEYAIILAVVAAVAVAVFYTGGSTTGENGTKKDGLEGTVQKAFDKAGEKINEVGNTQQSGG